MTALRHKLPRHHTARVLWWVGLLCLAAVPASAKVGEPPLSARQSVQPLSAVAQVVLAPTDAQAELATDQALGISAPVRFAVGRSVHITTATHGTWEAVPGGRLWRLRLVPAGATDLNLGFTRFWLPEGATLHVIAEGQSYFQGPYTARDNKPHGQLWTPVLPGDKVVVEMFVPTSAQSAPDILLTQVGTGYRDLFHQQGRGPTPLVEGSCNIDVVCPQAAPWTNEIRSVALYSINGVWTCSGTLIADAAHDFRSFFLTANHCGLNAFNAPTVVVYWNYQSPTCGTHGPGSLAQNQSGATFRAAKGDVDFALLELDEMPDLSFGVYYSGWDRSGATPAGAVGIHHPHLDVKAISFSSNALTTVSSCIGTGGTDTHWQVIWSEGVTEPGSSGSGLWDPATHLLVGTLSGGSASCSNPTGPDCYGKFAVAWDSGSSPDERLQDWLDSQNIGVTSVPGADPTLVSLLASAGSSLVSEGCSPTNGAVDPGETVTVSLALQNLGGVPTADLVAILLSGGGVLSPSAPQNYGALAGGGAPVSRPFTFTAEGPCGGSITPVLELQDEKRCLGAATFSIKLGAPHPVVSFAESFDGLVAPALPAGWTSVSTGGAPWATSTNESDTPPNAAFAPNTGFVSDNQLISPPISLTSSNALLSFRHSYDTEDGYDGGVLELSLNNGPFTDILDARGAFVTNGYNESLSQYYSNPLAGRQAWSGDSGGFITTIVALPAAVAGQTIQLRWRLGCDTSYGVVGWYVDTVSISEPVYTCCPSQFPPLIVDTRRIGPSTMAFSYDSAIGQSYCIETTTNLALPLWTPVQTNTGDGSRQSYTNFTTADGARYFRLRVQ